MQNQSNYPHTGGSKAVAIDARQQLIKLRMLQLMAVILSAAFALGLHLIFAH
jgi:hypothetical protein